MIELILFWASGLGALSLVVCLWAFAPLVVPLLLAVRLFFGLGQVSRTVLIIATGSCLPYALPASWLGGGLIYLAVLVIVICPPCSLWALFNKQGDQQAKEWILVLLAPYALGAALRIIPATISPVG